RTGPLQLLVGGLDRATTFQRIDMSEELLLEVEQEQAQAGTCHRVTRHQLRVRKALVDVFVDDVRLVQNQIALNEDGHLVVRVHQSDIFRLGKNVNVPDFEIHALFKQHKAAAMRVGAGRSGVKNHHGGELLRDWKVRTPKNTQTQRPSVRGVLRLPQ